MDNAEIEKLLSEIDGFLKTASEALDEAVVRRNRIAEIFASEAPPPATPVAGTWVWPVAGIVPRITQKFDAPVKYGKHEGIDIDVYDDPRRRLCDIVSVADGTITLIWNWRKTNVGMDAYGNHVVIVNDDGYTVSYCHLDHVAPGLVEYARVSAGQVIGVGGNTGNSNGAHLHLTVTHPSAPAIYVFGQRAVDPEPLFKK